MSDIEASNRSLSDDDADLFGDNDENATTTQASQPPESELEPEDEAEEDLKTVSITLPRHAVTQAATDGEATLLRVPVFLNVDAHPFDPTDFKEKVAQNAEERKKHQMNDKDIHSETVAEKLLNENTIRWRYTNAGDDEIVKQSNAHFVQWSDGLYSLKIGKEMLDFRELPHVDTFLAKSHVENEILQIDSTLSKSANLLPTSTSTETHRKLTQAVKNVQRKDKILNTLTEKDPMLKQRLADENERKTLKMKRQLENKRRLQEERMERTDSPGVGGARSFELAFERIERTYGDEYDEEDDFVADDDEVEMEDDASAEEEEFERGAERLKNLKAEGESKYREAAADEEDERRKRRRIIDSDDDE